MYIQAVRDNNGNPCSDLISGLLIRNGFAVSIQKLSTVISRPQDYEVSVYYIALTTFRLSMILARLDLKRSTLTHVSTLPYLPCAHPWRLHGVNMVMNLYYPDGKDIFFTLMTSVYRPDWVGPSVSNATYLENTCDSVINVELCY